MRKSDFVNITSLMGDEFESDGLFLIPILRILYPFSVFVYCRCPDHMAGTQNAKG